MRPWRSPAVPVCICAVVLLALGASGAAASSSTSVDYGDISHRGMANLGAAPTGWKLVLEVGLAYTPLADQIVQHLHH